MPVFHRFVKLGRSLDRFQPDPPSSPIPLLDTLAGKLKDCLAAASCEQDVQDFLEQFPHLLPGINTYHNGPLASVVAAKWPLGNDYVTDFAFISENSRCVEMTFVESESPTKRIFRNDGSFSRTYLDARQQLSDWNGWAQNNLRSAAALFGPMGRLISFPYHQVTLKCVLVFGRRSEFTTRKRQGRWAAENLAFGHSMQAMTYDRIVDRVEAEFIWPLSKRIAVCSYRDRAFHVKRIAI